MNNKRDRILKTLRNYYVSLSQNELDHLADSLLALDEPCDCKCGGDCKP